MKKIILIVLILLTVLPTNVFAQKTVSPTPIAIPTSAQNPPKGIAVTLSPTFISLSQDPGKTVSSEFKVTNNNIFVEYLEIRVMKFDADSEGSAPVPAEIEKGDEFAKWISFSDKQFVLNPGQSKTIDFEISPPKDANLGYYYALGITRISDGANTSGTSISGIAALPVLLEIRSPNAKREIQIVEFKTDKMFYEYLPTKFEVKIKNSGNIHVAPFGDIFVDSLLNQEIAIIPMNPGRGNVLPQTNRTYTAIWDDGFATRVQKIENGRPAVDAQGNPKFNTEYDFKKADKFRIGKYTANLILVYDNGQRDIPIEARVSFWIIPWKIMGIASVIALFALLGIKNTLLSILRRIIGTYRPK